MEPYWSKAIYIIALGNICKAAAFLFLFHIDPKSFVKLFTSVKHLFHVKRKRNEIKTKRKIRDYGTSREHSSESSNKFS